MAWIDLIEAGLEQSNRKGHHHGELGQHQSRELEGPICLLDMGDNVGGGSPGDGTLLAHAINDSPPTR